MSVFINTVVQADLAPTAAASSVPENTLGEAQFAGVVTEATIISEANLTADNTNNRTLTIFNRGQTGAGTTVVATYQTNVAGGSLVANDEKSLTLSPTPANLVFARGDVFECVETVAGSGVARAQCELTVRGTRS